MAKKKRHSEAEVAAKLAQANALVEQGRNQSDIAGALGISVMTYHRWRKSHPQRSALTNSPVTSANVDVNSHSSTRTAELQTENDRLRKIVTDLLLEKMRLEEELNRQRSGPKRPSR